jgi:antitoxin (DNA-binding transcriptional repressor) of toxin-antitoxin stability system
MHPAAWLPAGAAVPASLGGWLMEAVKIRELRGADLRERTRSGEPLAITNHGALIGVIIPVTQAWVEHLIDRNWSHVRQSIAEGEQAMAAGTSLLTIDDVAAQADARGYDEGQRHSTPERLAVPLVAAVVGGSLMQPPETRETLERLQALLNPAASAEDPPPEPSVHTVRMGDLTAGRIQRAGEDGQTLAVTHDRELIGIVIPVTRGLVEFLIEQNMSRVLYNIGLGEKQLTTTDKMTTLDQLLGQAGPARPADPPPAQAPASRESGIIR